MNVESIREDFPILKHFTYMDSASTSLSPEPVLRAMQEYERHYRANVGRGVHRLSEVASRRYWDAHQKVARFIGSPDGEVVFTKNTTEAINMVAGGLQWQRGDRVVTTLIEHHSNFLPWLRLRERGVDLTIVKPDEDGSLDLSAFESAIDDTTRLVAVSQASNVLGTVNPVKEVAGICQDHDALLLVDGAQSVPHIPVDAKDIGCDFLCFSGHKMLGPTGTGVLWMKEPDLEPFMVGGGMIDTVTTEGYTLADDYRRFEAGTPNIGGGIGLGRAVDYLQHLTLDEVRKHEERLTARLIKGLLDLEKVNVYGPVGQERRIGVVSFNIEGVHPHDVAHLLDEASAIMVRSGNHCCQPLMTHMGLQSGTVRASFYIYNTTDEVDRLIATIEEITRVA